MKSNKLKRYLMLLAAVGLIVVAAGGSSGTFATFNAEVANTNNYFATGTMFLHATKSGGSICKSEVASGNSNILSTNGCDTLFNLSNLSAGASNTVNLTLDNAGSISASKLELALGNLGCQNGKATITTTGAVTNGAQTNITVAALPYPLVKGTQVIVTDGTNSDTLTLNANAALNATSIDVTGSTTTSAYASGSKLQYAATFGTSNLCSNIQFYVAETNSSFVQQKCLFPAGAGACSFGSTHISDLSTYPSLTDVTSALWTGSTSTTALDAGKSRYLQIGWQAPGTLANAQQNQSATFDLVWHIEQ